MSSKTTTRQAIINTIALRVASRNFEAWRYEQCDPMTDTEMALFCRQNGLEYKPQPVTDQMINEMLDGYCGWTGSDAYSYYMQASEKALTLLVSTIKREAKKHLSRKRDLYLYEKEH